MKHPRFLIGLMLIAFALPVRAQLTQDISSGAARNIFDLLRNVPGVDISTPSGSARNTQQVFIRDSRNLKSRVPATFVLDGVIYDGDVSLINPMDVAAVTVLKDQAASAVYGARGFGGVIQITTKNGKGAVPAAVSTYEKSAYQYFISKGTDLRIIAKTGKNIATGVITKETDSSIFLRKKEILTKDIEKVEISIQ